MASVLQASVRSGPATSAASVTPHDSNDLTAASRGLWVSVAGNVAVIMADGQTVTLKNMTVGWHPISVTRVLATGTAQAAGDIVAVW